MSYEEWRRCLEPYANYDVSSLGRVRRAAPGRRTQVGRLMTPIKAGNGYWVVSPTVSGRNRQICVHTLVAQAFLGPPNGRHVNHIDGNKLHPAAHNLEYVTHAENMAHAGRTGLMARGEAHPHCKLSDNDIAAMRKAQHEGAPYSQLARTWRVSLHTVHHVINRLTRPGIAPEYPKRHP